MCFSEIRRRPVTRRRGFSFIEVMIVVVIIGLLAGTVTLASKHYLDRAKRSRAKADLATYQSALASFYADAGRYPTTDEGLAVLVPKFIDRVRADPWGRPYGYACPGRTGAYEVMSLGADGREGGGGADADISSDDLDVRESAVGGSGK